MDDQLNRFPNATQEKFPRLPKGSAPSSRAERHEFFLPVTGFVWLYPEEVAVTNHPAFQRLGKINQLGQAHLVFRGATHKRIEHVLGAVHIAQRMIAAVSHNQSKLASRGMAAPGAPSDPEARFIRLAALLHDIGHLAAGHTIEDELGLVGQHDADPRLDLIFGMGGDEFGSEVSTTLAQLIDQNYAKYVPENLAREGLTATTIVRLLIRKTPKDIAQDKFSKEAQILAKSSDIRAHVCTNMVGNTICADLLDYIYRDWYHVGKPRTFEDRILQYMEIRRTGVDGCTEASATGAADRSPDDKFVISLGASPKIRTDGVSAILALLEWRYELAETVLFHRVKVTAASMLDRALFELWENETAEDVISSVLHVSDEQLLDECIRIASSESSTANSERKRVLLIAEKILKRLKNRVLHKELRTWTVDQLGPDKLRTLKSLYAGSEGLSRNCAKNRAEFVRTLEEDFCLSPGSLTMYCSQAKAKIAEVAVSVGNWVSPFHEYEKEHGNALSGGHLLAQIERFKRLWRLQVFIDDDERKRLSSLGLLETIRTTIDASLIADDGLMCESMRQQALRLAQEKTLPYYQKPLISDAPANGPKYPSGAPSIRAFFKIEA